MIGNGMPIAHKSTERMRLSIFRWRDNQTFGKQFQTLTFFPRTAKPLAGKDVR